MNHTPAAAQGGKDSPGSGRADDRAEVEAVIERWERALARHDAEALLGCYHHDAVLESPVAAHLTGHGVCRGHEQLRTLFTALVARTPRHRGFDRGPVFTDGHRAMWEYPRDAEHGEQMDFVEVMDIDAGRIRSHRVYWGWYGVALLADDRYHRTQ